MKGKVERIRSSACKAGLGRRGQKRGCQRRVSVRHFVERGRGSEYLYIKFLPRLIVLVSILVIIHFNLIVLKMVVCVSSLYSSIYMDKYLGGWSSNTLI